MAKMKVIINVMLALSAIVPAMGESYESSRNNLTAKASDPNTLGWMEGSPPPEDKIISHPQSNYFSFPKLRWTVCHIREFLPTKQVSRGLTNAVPLDYAIDSNISRLSFYPIGREQLMSWQDSLEANYTDGMVILHQGKVVYEHYSGCLEETGKHAAMSMTKSLTGLIAEVLVAQNKLDEHAMVSSILPELKSSAFGDATVRQVMDMTTALKYSENYADPNADIWQYSAAANPLPKPKDYQGPNGYFEYLQTVEKQGQHGEAFGYKTINTDALGWIISRVTGKKLTQLFSELLWQKIGAEQDAYMTIDSKGTPFAGGGLTAGLRDLARIGQLMLNEGKLNGKQVISQKAIASIKKGGDKRAFSKAGYQSLLGGSYRSMWWVFHNEHGAYAARGVHGQTIYIDPTAEMVIVRFSSHPQAKNAAIDPTSLPAYQAVAEYLLGKQ